MDLVIPAQAIAEAALEISERIQDKLQSLCKRMAVTPDPELGLAIVTECRTEMKRLRRMIDAFEALSQLEDI